ncbi:hypothetical protein MCON_3406 [Methanothrix soehngenii GP6]|uniref:Uncharacterized protein n=1 Tax=Methanothrix soehngenii (strain ATCC 5969 / DSM 3671 / JCM 10134 / NBRC 103675 / OCM 69 / GP-6) TaxID=990316 RepID=F4BVN1_METSG|nr:hypothetical protein MCON_3406 [Methanothrix soehngenii GP6]
MPRFNSLFIGIGSAIGVYDSRIDPETDCFNSLFIGIGSAILLPLILTRIQLWRSFNSLFIGIGSAILLLVCSDRASR